MKILVFYDPREQTGKKTHKLLRKRSLVTRWYLTIAFKLLQRLMFSGWIFVLRYRFFSFIRSLWDMHEFFRCSKSYTSVLNCTYKKSYKKPLIYPHNPSTLTFYKKNIKIVWTFLKVTYNTLTRCILITFPSSVPKY